MLRFVLLILVFLAFAALLRMGLIASGLQEVSFFFAQTRIDVALNFFFVCLLLAFVVFYILLRLLLSLLGLPRQARLWRVQQREKEALRTLQQALMYFFAGRFVKTRKILKPLLSYPKTRAAATLISAEAAHAVQFASKRDTYATQMEQHLATLSSSESQTWHEALLLSQARWALRIRDAAGALACLDALPQGAARRTQALRLRLRAAQVAGKSDQALETANQLARHGAFSPTVAQTLLQRLMLDALQQASTLAQLEQTWKGFDKKVHVQIPLVCAYAEKYLVLADTLVCDQARALMRTVLLPLLKRYAQLDSSAREQLVQTLALALPGLEPALLQKIEDLQKQMPADPFLHYLSGVAAHALGLWGKAQKALQDTAHSAANATMQGHAQNLLAQIPLTQGTQ